MTVSSTYNASWVTTTSTGSTAALVATPYDPRWTASIPGASWIWATPVVDNSLVNEAYTFDKTFTVNGTPTAATLDINADNSYSVAVNGVTVASNPTELNYFVQNEGQFNIASALHNGTNTIAITVANFGVPSSTPQDNPAGLLYKLTIETPTCASTTPVAGLTVVKTVDDATPHEGDTVNYMLTVSALGPATSTGVTANDTLPSGLTFENATASVGNYATSTGTWTIGDMSASSTATLAIAAEVNAGTAGTTITNNATVGESVSSTNPDIANTSSSVSITVQPNGCTSNCGGGGGTTTPATSTLTVNVSGLNASDTASIAVNDLTASTTQTTSTGNGSSTFVLPTNDNYAVTATTTAPGYTVATSTGCAGTLATSTTCNVIFSFASSSISTADIGITKTVSNPTPNEGDNITYTLTATDFGPATSTDAIAQDILPPGVTFLSATSSQGTYDSTSGDWTIGDLPMNATATLMIGAMVNQGTAGQAITNTATITESTSTIDQNPTNNSSTATINVVTTGCNVNCGSGGGTTTSGGGGGSIPTAEIGITKTVDNSTPNAGDTVHYTVTVSAMGPSASLGAMASDTLPAGLTFDSASTSAGTYSATTGVWTIGTLDEGTNAILVITATVNSGDPNGETITNTATVSESTSVNDPLTGNNTASATITVGGNGGGGGGGGGNTTTSGGGGGGGGNTSTSGGGGSTGSGQVLGASTSCGLYLDQYIHPIRKYLNDPAEVKKLQIFLNENLGLSIPVTGYYGSLTIAAVDQFQVKYSGNVLLPWVPYGLPNQVTPTQYVYKTTQRWINLIMCPPLNLPLPQLP